MSIVKSPVLRARTMNQFTKKIALSILLLSTSMLGYGQSMNESFIAPDKFASLGEIQKWANSKQVRGFGYPESFEYSSPSLHVYVTWNGPYSGRSGVYSNAFVRSKDEEVWRRVDSTFFESPEPLSYVYVNPSSGALGFVGPSGATLKSIHLERSPGK